MDAKDLRFPKVERLTLSATNTSTKYHTSALRMFLTVELDLASEQGELRGISQEGRYFEQAAQFLQDRESLVLVRVESESQSIPPLV